LRQHLNTLIWPDHRTTAEFLTYSESIWNLNGPVVRKLPLVLYPMISIVYVFSYQRLNSTCDRQVVSKYFGQPKLLKWRPDTEILRKIWGVCWKGRSKCEAGGGL